MCAIILSITYIKLDIKEILMATAKKAPAKKSTTAKKAPAKKAPAKKATAKKQKTEYTSFKLSQEKTPFFTFKITDQTVYWLVLSVVVFLLALWVLHLHLELLIVIAEI